MGGVRDIMHARTIQKLSRKYAYTELKVHVVVSIIARCSGVLIGHKI